MKCISDKDAGTISIHTYTPTEFYTKQTRSFILQIYGFARVVDPWYFCVCTKNWFNARVNLSRHNFHQRSKLKSSKRKVQIRLKKERLNVYPKKCASQQVNPNERFVIFFHPTKTTIYLFSKNL